MAFRRLQDADGRTWDVWESRPTIIDRRGGRERRTSPREQADRRQRAEARVAVGPDFRDGWLMFQSGGEWRRVAPIPAAWQALADHELLALLAGAGSAGGASQPRR